MRGVLFLFSITEIHSLSNISVVVDIPSALLAFDRLMGFRFSSSSTLETRSAFTTEKLKGRRNKKGIQTDVIKLL